MLRENYGTWRCGRHEIGLARPRIMGILNVTPDSFSDGGKNLDPEAAIQRGLQMLDEGADIIDVGGESTRPGHRPVSPKEEAERIIPVVRGLVAEGAVVSVDTRHAEVAQLCARL
ncbi:MAG: dihydropteroate synthase, partial [Coriobacteriaceae bacterium]|nr:dihydropteroate synthase [Coriobacteriaceae bacterium]